MAVEAITNRLSVLNSALTSAIEVNVGYEQIIDLLAKCPPFLDHHLEELEQQLTLARQQLADLIQYRKNMYVDSEKARMVRIIVAFIPSSSLFFNREFDFVRSSGGSFTQRLTIFTMQGSTCL